MGMAANALASTPRRRSTRAEAEADAAARHRLNVIAASVPDVVASAGGWLADRALAGWDVNVFVPDTDDVGALRILGLTPRRLAEATADHTDARRPTAVAVSADAMTADPGMRATLAGGLGGEIAEVTVWGPQVPQEMADQLCSVEHVPSTAARAFKSHAMRAAALDAAAAGAAEVFHTGPLRTRPRLAAVPDRAGRPPAAVWAPAR